MTSLVGMAESGWVPDTIVRAGMRYLIRQRLVTERKVPSDERASRLSMLRNSQVALHTAVANEQHYEIPTSFFQAVLGPRLKYSASMFPHPHSTLAEAELHTLELYRERMNIESGARILDLGCGWGSFSLWMAEQDPTVSIVAVSNSSTQRAFIERRARDLGLKNIEVITADINTLELPLASFDRAISIEMLEHVRNYDVLLRRISSWLKKGGALFAHIFCHKDLLYTFETEGQGNWMGRHFFTGGLMPAASTLPHFQDDMTLEQSWLHDGSNYERTARAWLENMDRNQDAVTASLEQTYPPEHVELWRRRWRMFFMACEEMFAYDHGQQWQIAHYRFING